ncbi:MAG: ABC transporter ATP-binding protein [Bacteroidota bacterium]
MQNKIAISVNSISKTYKLYHSFRERFKEAIHPKRKKYHKKFFALKNINIKIEEGEVIGIIGQNGSGKSTLLKILSSVVSPSSGSFECKGKTATLLELGGGFNKELTGIQNLYFLGAIQGYSKKEMSKKIQSILAFADIGDYAYQPVSTYSSGMYVRLAFAMSVNIDPDILITDEALSVGDIRFQQKCFRKIREFKDQGKTIVMCTHSLTAVKDFCTRAIWLHKGEIREQGNPNYVTDCYNAFMTSKEAIEVKESHENKYEIIEINLDTVPLFLKQSNWYNLSVCESYGNRDIQILNAAIVDTINYQNIRTLRGGEKVCIVLYLIVNKIVETPAIEIILNNSFGTPIFKINSDVYKQSFILELNKPNFISFEFEFPKIGNNRYTFSLDVLSSNNGDIQHHHWVHDALIIDVANDNIKHFSDSLLIIEDTIIKKLI